MKKKKILTHTASLVVGLLMAYYSYNFPILPQEIDSSNLWAFFIKQYWWLMIIFFVIGYGITFLIINFFGKIAR
ncbi:hypothetical protein GOV13_02925 [Candidatus Pacearchaeota archaeon]|nr:hypothetical protein [Candidatus Pacearchaeota archaeon]